jgi:hypothetical protein
MEARTHFSSTLFCSEYFNSALRKVTTAGNVSVIFYGSSVFGMCLDGLGSVYVMHSFENAVYRVSSTAVYTRVAGTGVGGYSGDGGPATLAK